MSSTPAPPEFPCSQCGRVFTSEEDREEHLFHGHLTSRPSLILLGRECGRSRVAVTLETKPRDWSFDHTHRIIINGETLTSQAAKNRLASVRRGVVEVHLEGEKVRQVFELVFDIADRRDLEQVDRQLQVFIRSRSLTIPSIEQFLLDTSSYCSADQYRFGLATYFYGVLAREKSSESGLINSRSGVFAYSSRYQEASRILSRYQQPGAEAVCGLIAFHFNQFEGAVGRVNTPRLSGISLRLRTILDGGVVESRQSLVTEPLGLDYALSDLETERVLRWCAIPLDGTANIDVFEAENAIPWLELVDQVKVRIVAAEHYLAAGLPERGLVHAKVLRHSPLAEGWSDRYVKRANEVMR